VPVAGLQKIQYDQFAEMMSVTFIVNEGQYGRCLDQGKLYIASSLIESITTFAKQRRSKSARNFAPETLDKLSFSTATWQHARAMGLQIRLLQEYIDEGRADRFVSVSFWDGHDPS